MLEEVQKTSGHSGKLEGTRYRFRIGIDLLLLCPLLPGAVWHAPFGGLRRMEGRAQSSCQGPCWHRILCGGRSLLLHTKKGGAVDSSSRR